MDKRIFLAVALSLMVMVGYQTMLHKMYPEKFKYAAKNTLNSKSPAAASDSAAVKTAGAVSSGEKLSIDNDLSFENDTLKLLFNKKSGSFREVAFKKFIDSDSKKPLVFISQDFPEGAITSVALASKNKTFSNSAVYVTQISGNQIVASAVDNGIRITKKYEFSDSVYSGKLKVSFENTSAEPIEFNYQLFAGSSIHPRHSIDQQYIEANFYSNESGKLAIKHIKENRPDKNVKSAVPVQWVAIKDRHFSLILKPQSDQDFFGFEEGLGNRHLRASLLSQKIVLAPHTSVENEFTFYMGPNEVEELTPIGLDPIVNFGKLDMIGRLLVGSLEMLHKLVRNYGLAIILLTVLINVLFFPFTRVSYLSMKRMQLIQPQINKLKEQYKNSPEKMNKATMELYKKYKVNPFGGCLPMLMQMPVFIALYVSVSKSVILINSKFLWINDLSSPDKVHLPFTLPMLGDNIHILPLIMVAAMVFQQRFTQVKMQNQDPAIEQQQKMMGTMMPLIFGFIFYSMPSSLVLYWLTNTLLTTLQQLRLKNLTLEE